MKTAGANDGRPGHPHRKLPPAFFIFLFATFGTLAAAQESLPDADDGDWPVMLWANNGEAEAREAVRFAISTTANCAQVKQAAYYLVQQGATTAGMTRGAVVENIHRLAEHLSSGEDVQTKYEVLWGETASSLRAAWEVMHLLSMSVLIRKSCYGRPARHILGKALLPLQAAVQQQISTMWWMFDASLYSNTNSPAKHFKAVFDVVYQVEAVFAELTFELPMVLEDMVDRSGHEEHGMFMNSTVMYRKLFPETALVDQGLLRYMLRLLPHDVSVGDFGSLDGYYSRWLNRTGLVSAYAVDGVEGVTELTDGLVFEADLASPLTIPWHPEAFDWVLCLEVAEHIPGDRQEIFLSNLNKYARSGLVISWATPDIVGEGHVSCLETEDSRALIESLGFKQDEEATAGIRAAAEIPWIAQTVAVYRRPA